MSTLELLEGDVWPDPEFDSHLVLTCNQLRKKDIEQFTTEDLRIMIGQSIGLKHLMPIALTALEADPLAAGDFYPGDLLNSVTRAESSYFDRAPETLARVLAVSQLAIKALKPLPNDTDLIDNLQRFIHRHAA